MLYSLAIIGEAIQGIPQEIRDRHPEVPWRQIVATRNIVVHVYFGVKLEVVWDTVHFDLPSLVATVQAILGEEAPREPPQP